MFPNLEARVCECSRQQSQRPGGGVFRVLTVVAAGEWPPGTARWLLQEPLLMEGDLRSPHVLGVVSYFIFQASNERFDVFADFKHT